jgi:hypothetical protein
MATDWEVTQAMETFGGSFVRNLAALCHTADPVNLAKIKATWPDYWLEYAEIAAQVKARGATRGES